MLQNGSTPGPGSLSSRTTVQGIARVAIRPMPCFIPTVISEPIDLSEATGSASVGASLIFDAGDAVAVSCRSPTAFFSLAGVGLVITCLRPQLFQAGCRTGWMAKKKQDPPALLPWATAKTVASYTGIILESAVSIGAKLARCFRFGGGTALLVAFCCPLLTAVASGSSWKRLMGQVQDGSFQAVDLRNFASFFGGDAGHQIALQATGTG